MTPLATGRSSLVDTTEGFIRVRVWFHTYDTHPGNTGLRPGGGFLTWTGGGEWGWAMRVTVTSHES